MSEDSSSSEKLNELERALLGVDQIALSRICADPSVSKSSAEIIDQYIVPALERQLSLQTERMPLGHILWDNDLKVQSWNPAAEEIFGFTAEEALGRHPLELIVPPDAKTRSAKAWKGVLEGDGTVHSVSENVTKGGYVIVCDWYNTPLIAGDGKIIGVMSMVQDVTERVRAQEELRSERERLEVTLASIGDAVIATDTMSRITLMNNVAEALTGWSSAEAEGRPLHEVFNIINERTGKPAPDPVRRALRTGEIVGLANHTALISKDGGEITIADSCAPIRDSDSRVVGAVLVFRDVTAEKEAEQALINSEERFRSITETANDAIICSNDKGDIVLWNRGAEEIFGYTAAEALGQAITMIMPERFRDAHRKGLHKVSSNGGSPHKDSVIGQTVELVGLHKNGTEFPLELSLASWKSRDEVFFAGIARDITQRKQAETELAEEREKLAVTLGSIGDGVIATDISGRVEFLNQVAEDLTGWKQEKAAGKPLAEVFRIVSEKTGRPAKNPVDECLKTGKVVELENHTILIRSDGSEINIADSCAPIRSSTGDVIGTVLVFRDVTAEKLAREKIRDEEERYRTLFEQSPNGVLIIDSETGLPIEFNDRAHEQLGYSRQEFAGLRVSDFEAIERPSETKARMRKILREGRDYFETKHRMKSGEIRDVTVDVQTIPYGQKQAFHAVFRDITAQKRANELSGCLNEVNTMLYSTHDPDGVLSAVLAKAAEVCRSDTAGIGLRDGDEWVLTRVCGMPDEWQGARFGGDQARASNLVAESKRVLVFDHAQSDPRLKKETLEQLGIQGLVCAPLIVRSEVFGVISFNRTSTAYPFSPEEIDFAEKLAASVSLALESARLHAEEREARQLGDALNDIDADLHSTLAFDDIMGKVVDATRSVLGADVVDVAMREQNDWILAYSAGRPKRDAGRALRADDARVSRLALDSKSLVVIEDVSVAGQAYEIADGEGPVSVVAAPLVVKGDVAGVFGVSYREKTIFSQAQKDFVSKLATSLSLAIENARLYSAQQGIADALQESMLKLPRSVSGVEFGHLYKSATQAAKVGGDFYDLFELDGRRVGVVIGDVSGKGVAAATTTSLVKTAIRAYAGINCAPADVLTRANELVLNNTPASTFVTVFFGVLDTASGCFTYCCAGHPPALLKSEGEIELLLTNSPAIGAFEGVEFIESDACLKPGQQLVMYTDGVTEARSEHDFFNEERLVALVKKAGSDRVRELPGTIFGEVSSFANDSLQDDIALLCVSWKGNRAKSNGQNK